MRVLGSSAAWRYIATNSGAMRQYPGRQTYNNRSAENCHYRHVVSFGQRGWGGKAHLNSVYPYLNSQKFPFHSSLAQAKLAVSTASVISLSQCLNRQLFRRSCFTIMLLRQSLSSREAIRSEVADATGYVKHSLNIFWTTRISSLVTGVFQYQGAVAQEIRLDPLPPPPNCSAACDKCFITFRNKNDALKSFFP